MWGGKIPPAQFRHLPLEPPKIEQCSALSWLLLNMDALQNSTFIGGTPPTKNQIWRRKYRKYASRLLSLFLTAYLELHDA